MASLGDLMVRVGADIAGFESAMGTVYKKMDMVMHHAGKATMGFQMFGMGLKDLGKTLSIAITAPIAAMGIAVTKMAADFELGMRRVTSLMGGVTDREFRQLSDATLELSKRMGVDAVKATDALYEAISAGVPKENAIEFLTVATRAAIGGVTDTKVAVDGLTTILQAYALGTEEAKNVSDAMFQAVNVGKLTFSELAAAVGIAAGTAKLLNISYQDLLSSGATLTLTTGQGIGEAMTMLQSAMKSLIDPSNEMAVLIEKIGFKSGVAAIKSLGLQEALQRLWIASGQNVEVFEKAWRRVEGFRGAIGLTGDNAIKAAAQLREMSHASDGLGAAQLAYNEINKSVSRQFDMLLANLKGTAIELGTKLLPIVNHLLAAAKPLVDRIGALVDAFGKLSPATQGWTLAAIATIAAIGPLLIGLGSLISSLGALRAAYLGFSGIFHILISGLVAFASTLKVVVFAVQNNLTAALSSGETALLRFGAVLAVLGGGAVAWSIVKDLRESFSSLSNKLTALIGPLDLFKTKLDAGKESAERASVFASIFTAVLDKLRWTVDAISKIDIWGGLFGALKAVAGPLGALNQVVLALGRVVDSLLVLKGVYPDMDKATKAAADNFQKQALAQVRVSEESLRSLVAARNLTVGQNLASKATMNLAKTHKDLSKELSEAKQSYEVVLGQFKRGRATLDELNAAKERLRLATETLGRRFKDSAEHVKKFDQASLNLTIQVQKLHAATQEAAIFSAWEQTRLVFGYVAEESRNLVEQLSALVRASMNLRDIAPPDWLFGQGRIQQQAAAIGQLEAAIRSLGDNSVTALGERMAISAKHYETLKASGIASAREILRAEKEVLEARMRYEQEAGVAITEGQKKRLAELEKLTADHVGKTGEVWKAFQRQVSTVLTDLSKNLTDLIFQGGKFKDIMVESFKQIGKAITRFVIEEALAELSKAIWKLIKDDLGALSKALAGIVNAISGLFGGKGAAASVPTAVAAANAAQAAQATAGATAQFGAATAAGGAAGGIGGLVEPISSAASAITGVLQYLQGRRMEQDIGRIEVSTRGTLSQLISIQETLNKYLPALVDWAKRIYEALGSGVASFGRAVTEFGDAATRFADDITGAAPSITAAQSLDVLTGAANSTVTVIGAVRENLENLATATGRAAAGQVAYYDTLADMLTGPATSSMNAYWESVKRTGKSMDDAINEWIAASGNQFSRPLPYQNEYIASLEEMIAKLQKMGWTLEQATQYAGVYTKRQDAYLNLMVEGYRKRGMSEEDARKKAVAGWKRSVDLGQNAVLTLIGEQLGMGEALRNAPAPGPAGIWGAPPLTVLERRIAEIEELIRDTIPDESQRWKEAKRVAEQFAAAQPVGVRVPLAAPWEAVLAFLREHGITDIGAVEEVRRAWERTQSAMDEARQSMNQAAGQFQNLGATALRAIGGTVSSAVASVTGGMAKIATAIAAPFASYEQYLAGFAEWMKKPYSELMAGLAQSQQQMAAQFAGLPIRMIAAAPVHIPTREEYEARTRPAAQWYQAPVVVNLQGGSVRDREFADYVIREFIRQAKATGQLV